VVDTVVGYTGYPSAPNDKLPPTYDDVCFGRNWVEGVRVVYDDSKLGYEELLDAFFEAQEPKVGSRQYSSIIFAGDEEQQRRAQRWLDAAVSRDERRSKDGLPASVTSIEPASDFYRAESYHQRYWQKFRPRAAALLALAAVASGALDGILPEEAAQLHRQVRTVANAVVLLGCAYVTIERFVDRKVVKL